MATQIHTMLKLLIGLGNPTPAYQHTRHNAGFWFIETLTDRHHINLSFDKKYNAMTGRGNVHGCDVSVLMPLTYMNKSGESVMPFMNFYNIQANDVLIAHDELDIACGEIRLKTGGGHGGHNGLRDIVPHIGADFHRLRIGIGRPTHGSVSNFVLGTPSQDERISIHAAIDCALDNLPLMLSDQMAKAQSYINGFRLPN